MYKFVIWSMEHDGWWAPDCRGYVHRLVDAGRYDEDDAQSIQYEANRWGHTEEWAIPEEVALAIVRVAKRWG